MTGSCRKIPSENPIGSQRGVIDFVKNYLSEAGIPCEEVECNPLLGPQLMKAVQDLMEGKELPLRIITEEKVYDQTDAREVMKERRY